MAFSFSETDPFGDLAERSMAESVTRHALMPSEGQPGGWEFLLCGIDTLDLGLYVEWDYQWTKLVDGLQKFKDQAHGKNGILDQTPEGRTFLHLPSGKAPNYRFHLQFPEHHLYIGITNPPRLSPNVYLSLSAETLWRSGVTCSVDRVIHDLAGFGGRVQLIQVSRLDLCADFRLPGGISLDVLNRLKVARSRELRTFMTGGILETAYIGAAKAPIALRLYDKGKEVNAKGIKLWFGELWNTDDLTDIWRVEFQLRRTALKQFGINSLDDLQTRASGLWEYLTGDWVSLRLPDNSRQNRRELHPWWQEVQALASQFGPAADVQRIFGSIHPASVEWYVAHIAGCLPSFAARLGIDQYHEALNQLNNEITQHWFERNYQGEYEKRAIKLGRNVDDHGGSDGHE